MTRWGAATLHSCWLVNPRHGGLGRDKMYMYGHGTASGRPTRIHVQSIGGESLGTSVHNKVRDALARAIQLYGGTEARWHRTEVRSDNFFYPRGDKRGPDIPATVNGVATFFDVTGVATMSTTHQKHFRRADKA